MRKFFFVQFFVIVPAFLILTFFFVWGQSTKWQWLFLAMFASMAVMLLSEQVWSLRNFNTLQKRGKKKFASLVNWYLTSLPVDYRGRVWQENYVFFLSRLTHLSRRSDLPTEEEYLSVLKLLQRSTEEAVLERVLKVLERVKDARTIQVLSYFTKKRERQVEATLYERFCHLLEAMNDELGSSHRQNDLLLPSTSPTDILLRPSMEVHPDVEELLRLETENRSHVSL